jgi:2-keto-4-pentenoate hydratase
VEPADDTGVVGLADRLWQAAEDRRPIEPITRIRPDLTVQDTYAIQAHNVRRRIARGAILRGRRMGRTSRPRQLVVGTEPDFGVLLDDMFLDEGDDIPLELFVQPRVVSTIAFVLAADLAGPGGTVADALTAVAGVMPAIEIVDSRIASWQVQVADTIADNASAGRVVLGGRITPVAAVNLRLVGVLLQRNGVPIESAAGAAAFGNPARWCSGWRMSSEGQAGACAGVTSSSSGRCTAWSRSGRATSTTPTSRTSGAGAVRERKWRMSAAPDTARPDSGTGGDARRIADALIRAQLDRTPIAPSRPGCRSCASGRPTRPRRWWSSTVCRQARRSSGRSWG